VPSDDLDFAHTFTVFTSTRDRAHTLDRPFDSLKGQTFRDFEWLIIDNGSTDGTPELIERFKVEADFPIRYIRQEDGGKHSSMNRAVGLANGAFFVTLDSDDGCIPTALERLKHHWDAIPLDVRDRFTGVTALCLDQDGSLVGTPFPHDPTDSDSREIRYRFKVKGEKWGFHRTEILREHPFPETPGYRGLIPPTAIWAEIARTYKTRYVNEGLHVYWQDQVLSLSRPTSRLDDAYGGMLEAQSIINNDLSFFPDAPTAFVIMGIKYSRSAFHTGRGANWQYRALTTSPARVLWAATLPAGWLAFRLEKLGLSGYVRRMRLLIR
jgi:glycosyltransferase involved in cell wall biosynthesis